jgi:hypothetical protein
MAGLDKIVREHGLLAKWRLDSPDEGYVPARGFLFNGHMMEVMDACNFLFNAKNGKPGTGTQRRRFRDAFGGTYKSMGHALHDIMDLEGVHGVGIETFYRWCFLAALAHDLGKAGGEFQKMLWMKEMTFQNTVARHRGVHFTEFTTSNIKELGEDEAREVWKLHRKQPRHIQAYRHEFLSALLLYFNEDIRAWFRREAGSDEGFAYILSGAFGHHLKANTDKAFKPSNHDVWDGYKPPTIFLEKMSDRLRSLLRGNALGFKCAPFPELEDWKNHPRLRDFDAVKRSYTEIGLDPLFHQVVDNRLSAAIKWMVILPDTLGSISQKKNKKGEWERGKATRHRIYRALEDVFAPRKVDYYGRVAAHLLDLQSEEDWATFRTLNEDEVCELTEDSLLDLQQECKGVDGNLLVCASTGTGKTVACFVWSGGRPWLRLIVTTPTTDTSTCLFFDYADQKCDSLRHSRSDMDRPDFKISLRSTPEDNDQEDEEEALDASILTETFARFESDVTFTTADQVLGIMAFYRKSVLWLPYLLSSQIVFDEFPAYDSTMWGWYMRFLEWFPGLRTAHMSATVPDYLREQVESRIFTTEVGKAIRDPRGQGQPSCIPRYQVRVVTESEARSHFDLGTLWITNTVVRCQRIGLDFLDALVYHSHFQYIDRNGRRKGVMKDEEGEPLPAIKGIRDRLVKAFQRESKNPVRAVATQVAELSLDISALQLITECCPPVAFIQRCGRTNRVLYPESTAEVLVYMPDKMSNGLPYSRLGDGRWEAVYESWMDFYRSLEGDYPRGISQAELEKRLQHFYNDPENQDRLRAAYTQVYRTFRRNLREGSVTTPVLLKSVKDAFEAKHGRKMSRNEVRWFAVPALLNKTQRMGLKLKKNIHEHHYILDDSDPTILYDSRLGLLDMTKL